MAEGLLLLALLGLALFFALVITQTKTEITCHEHDPLYEKLLNIISNSEFVCDNSSSRSLPSMNLSDGKNTVYFCWYHTSGRTHDLRINGLCVPKKYDHRVSKLIHYRIESLREEHMKKMLNSIKEVT